MEIMHMRKMYPGVDTSMSPLRVIQMLSIITTMVLAIESLNVRRGTYSHMEAGITILCRKVNLEHLEVRDLHGAKGGMSLQEKKVHRF